MLTVRSHEGAQILSQARDETGRGWCIPVSGSVMVPMMAEKEPSSLS